MVMFFSDVLLRIKSPFLAKSQWGQLIPLPMKLALSLQAGDFIACLPFWFVLCESVLLSSAIC
jgi:hypothetical protein